MGKEQSGVLLAALLYFRIILEAQENTEQVSTFRY